MNWAKFDAILLADLSDAIDFDEMDLESKIATLTEILIRAESEASDPRRAVKISPRWWSHELDNLRLVKTKLEKWQREKKKRGPEHEQCMQARANFINARTKYVNGIRYHKRRS